MDTEELWNYPFQRGDTWRSTAIYHCQICFTKTNKWIMGGWPGMGPRILCPAGIYYEHETLDKDLNNLGELEKKLKRYEAIGNSRDNDAIQHDVIQQYLQTLRSEQQLLEAVINKLRKKFWKKNCNDVEGIEATAQIRPFYFGNSRYIPRMKLG